MSTPAGPGGIMQAVVARDRSAGLTGLTLEEMPYPHVAENDVVVEVHAGGFTTGELEWPGTWTDRAGRDRTPSIPGHDVSGVVVRLGYGTTGLSVGQRVLGLTDWTRNGTLAEYVAVEARNLAPLPDSIGHVVGGALPISGLTAWQALFDHGRLVAGQSVLVHGAAGSVGSLAVQLAADAGAVVIGTGRSGQRRTVLDLGAAEFVDIDSEALDRIGEVDMVLDIFGGAILERSLPLVRPGGSLVTIAGEAPALPRGGRSVGFVVEAHRDQLSELAARVHDGRLRLPQGEGRPLSEAPKVLASGSRRVPGRTLFVPDQRWLEPVD